MKRVFIGDVHGCLDEMKALLDKVGPGQGDMVISVGDLVDKGPDSAGCVKFARESKMVLVRGNHEDWYLRFRKHELKKAQNPAYVNPMKALPPEGEDLFVRLSEEDWDWLGRSPLYLAFPGLVVVHGGLRPGFTPETHDKGEMLRLRWVDNDGKHVPVDYDAAGGPAPARRDNGLHHWVERYLGTDDVVYGHEAHTLSAPYVYQTPRKAKCFGIDTGCVHGGHLTALILDEKGACKFEKVRARKTYKTPHAAIPWG